MKKFILIAGTAIGACGALGCSSALDLLTPDTETPSLVLITLDTTRSDYLGVYGAQEARTPVLDSLAGRGTRYSRALTASPLTLPAHASLLTGLDPPAHGLLDNGTAALPPAIPTLASTLSATGYSCAAFVSSRVLDRRFGLDRGFAVYDDFMAAEQTGEYGYPERDAAAVTSSAISWLGGLSSSRPYFLWVHYYDPHAPYSPPPEWEGESNRANYAGEIAYMDQEIGRLLSALPGQHPETLIAVVGDHGESLGEHGERTHGVFLYRAVLEVPLIVAGPGVPESEVIDEAVATRRLPATLLRLLGAVEAAQDLGPGLPGLTGPEAAPAPEPIYSATWMPANAYGWSPLRAVSDQRWRFILAPRPELYDYRADAGEEENRIGVHPREVERLKQLLAQFEEAPAISRADPSASSQDPQLLAALRSLGYLSGSAGSEQAGPALDPKDGLGLLAEFERAGQLLTENPEDSLAVLHRLVERNPDNIPFLGKLAQAELSAGNGEAALETYRRAVALNPGLDFQRRHAER